MKTMNKALMLEKGAKTVENVLTEGRILSKMSSPFVVNLWTTFQDPSSLHMVGFYFLLSLSFLKSFKIEFIHYYQLIKKEKEKKVEKKVLKSKPFFFFFFSPLSPSLSLSTLFTKKKNRYST